MPSDTAKQTTPDDLWRTFIKAAHAYAEKGMDQWERVKFETEFGPVYLTLSRKPDYPDSFETVDAEGNLLAIAGQEANSER